MARDFNGSSDLLDMGDIALIDGAFPMTVGAWVKVDSIALNFTVLARGNTTTGSAGWAFAINSGHVRFDKSGVDVYQSTLADVRAAVGVWSFACAVITSTTAATLYKVTLDGTVTSENDTDSSGGFAGTGNNSRIGVFARTTNSNWFDGSIAQVSAFVGQAFNASEVLALSRYGPAGVVHSPDGYWSLAGASLADTSGNGNNATATGTTEVGDPPIVLPAGTDSLNLAYRGAGIRR